MKKILLLTMICIFLVGCNKTTNTSEKTTETKTELTTEQTTQDTTELTTEQTTEQTTEEDKEPDYMEVDVIDVETPTYIIKYDSYEIVSDSKYEPLRMIYIIFEWTNTSGEQGCFDDMFFAENYTYHVFQNGVECNYAPMVTIDSSEGAQAYAASSLLVKSGTTIKVALAFLIDSNEPITFELLKLDENWENIECTYAQEIIIEE